MSVQLESECWVVEGNLKLQLTKESQVGGVIILWKQDTEFLLFTNYQLYLVQHVTIVSAMPGGYPCYLLSPTACLEVLLMKMKQ